LFLEEEKKAIGLKPITAGVLGCRIYLWSVPDCSKAQQRVVMQMLDGVLAQQGR
jgi:hypothetical protein